MEKDSYGYDRRHYNDILNKLKYENKVVMNDVADYLKRKNINRLAKQHILAEIADKVMDCQDRGVPLEQLFGNDSRTLYDRLSENAPLVSTEERILAIIRNIAAISLLASIIAVIVSKVCIDLDGFHTLKIICGALIGILCLPLICFRDAFHMPNNVIVLNPQKNALKSMLPMMIYSVVCIVGVIAYIICFWIYPDTLKNLNKVNVHVLVWALVSALVFFFSMVIEIHTVKRKFRAE